jgi:hypothetical protein
VEPNRYEKFIVGKSQMGAESGFDPITLPSELFDFQASLVTWAQRRGRAAILADTGLGKTIMQLAWADNVVRKTNKPVLLLTPLAVSHQTVAEAEKFGIEAHRAAHNGVHRGSGIIVTNYERLHYFDPDHFAGVVLDESSILKSFDGSTKTAITEFMRTIPYRLLCTATAAPNDYIELGTSSEALGYLGYTDMLTRFFKSDSDSIKPFNFGLRGQFNQGSRWRFKGHAAAPFWKWVCSWARALRKPSDVGGDDSRFVLPPMFHTEHVIKANTAQPGMLFALPAHGLDEQRQERRRTITERCEKVAELVTGTGQPALSWCHLNAEGDLLARLIPDAVQISGADSDDAKEEAFIGFMRGDIRVLVTKPSIGAWGLNFQHCAHVTMFPSHSYEQTYQGIRRCWRFGQKRSVQVDIVTSEGERGVLENYQRKAQAADRMFAALVVEMNNAINIERSTPFTNQTEVPSWL